MIHTKRSPIMLTIVGTIGIALLLSGCSPRYLVLNPQGPVGREELHLIYLSAILCLIVIVPVMALLAFFIFRYRDTPDNTAPYHPNWSDSKVLEIVWWGVPIVIVGILGYVTAKGTFQLTRPLQTSAEPITIQVTSLDWKWVFQYPGQGVASVNACVIPTGVPVRFELTSDAPMNSFWVPQLGGQEYTMPGMAMRLWLQADTAGTYYGHGANFTGRGFTFMSFTVKAESAAQFNGWVQHVKSHNPPLTMLAYQQLKQPSVVGVRYYSAFPKHLFDNTIWADGGRYMAGMMPGSGSTAMQTGMSTSANGTGQAQAAASKGGAQP